MTLKILVLLAVADATVLPEAQAGGPEAEDECYL